jgi:hypothetical protein
VYAQHGQDYFIADHRYKLYGDGRFVDISDSPIAENPIAPDDESARKAKERLAAALTELRADALTMPVRRTVATKPKPRSPAEQAAQLKADLQLLVDQKVIAAADYWLERADQRADYDGGRVSELLISAANQFKPATRPGEAVAILNQEGVLSAVSYWEEHAMPGRRCSASNVPRLINKMADRLRAK